MATSPQQQTVAHTIQVSVQVDPKGNPEFTYIPAVKRAYPGDTIRWTSDGAPFSISFKGDSPSKKFEAHGERCSDPPNQFASPPIAVRADARGHFHYVVAIELDERVYIDGACPEIIITEA